MTVTRLREHGDHGRCVGKIVESSNGDKRQYDINGKLMYSYHAVDKSIRDNKGQRIK